MKDSQKTALLKNLSARIQYLYSVPYEAKMLNRLFPKVT